MLLEQLGAPIPALPVLLLAGAKGMGDAFYIGYALVLAIVASAIGDLAWYWAGRRYGHRVLRLLCRLTLSPDSCVRQTETVYERRGAMAIVIAKFVPGLATVAPPLAGALRLGVWRFLVLDCLGAALYCGAGLALGVAFHTQIHWLIERIEGFGSYAVLIVLGALALYVAYRWRDRQRFVASLRAGRIEVAELNEMMSRGEDLLVLDVRSRTHRELDGRRIPGARGIDLDDLEGSLADVPRDREVVVYCACPNEVTAVRVAMQLRERGFRRVRPLTGGVEAWAAAGFLVETA